MAWLASDYESDEVFPDSDAEAFPSPPCTSVRVLQELPVGVDALLMTRVGRLFPNLSVIRTFVPYTSETMLFSIWAGCPNIKELFLTLDEGPDIGHIPQNDRT